MIFVCGDTHGNLRRFEAEFFPEQKSMTRDDHVIICGDFGGIWGGSKEEQKQLDRLNDKPFTTLWVDGNHENFDRINAMPVSEWHGGKVHRVRENVLHLMRGQIFDIGGYKFFTMGGASSHDIDDGILEPSAPGFEEEYWTMRRMNARFRVNHRSWWRAELPSDEEYAEAIKNLDQAHWKVDYVLTHCAPTGLLDLIGKGYATDRLTDFLDTVSKKLDFRYWFFGHYHDNRAIGQNYILLWEQLIQIDPD